MAAKPHFFIVRPNLKQVTADGEIYIDRVALVPLVVVDELPKWLDIPSAPRELSVEQTMGLFDLGTIDKSNKPYAVNIIQHATPAARQQPPPAMTNPSTSGIAASVRDPRYSLPPRLQPKPPAMTNPNTTPANNTTTATTPTSSNNDTTTRTEHCRHWCHYGTCRWGPRCRYLHVMPTTAAELAAIGLRKIPAWRMATGAGVGTNPPLGTRFHHYQQHKHQQQQQHWPYQQQSPQNRQHRHHHHLRHAHQQVQQQGHHHHSIDNGHGHNRNHNHNHNPNLPNPGAAPADNTGRDETLDPRNNVRFAYAGGVDAGAGGGGGGGGAPVGMGNRATRAQELQEAMALLRKVGLGGGGGGGGGGGYDSVRPRRREINPLQRVGWRGVVDRGVSLRGGEADMAAASASAASAGAGGQMQSGTVAVPGQDNVAQGGREGGTVQQHLIEEEADKLVDV